MFTQRESLPGLSVCLLTTQNPLILGRVGPARSRLTEQNRHGLLVLTSHGFKDCSPPNLFPPYLKNCTSDVVTTNHTQLFQRK